MSKKFHRVTGNKVIAGVCSGVAEYFNLDPTLVRLIWIVLLFFFGVGLFAYLILWLIAPKG